MNVSSSSSNTAQTIQVKPKTENIGVLVAQRSLEAARRNQQSTGTDGTKAKQFAHPYLGHNVDIYV